MKLATLCYVRQSDKTLMIHRVKKQNDMHAGKWNGLGGKLEPGETPEECAVREIREESGLVASNPLLKGILTFPMFDAKDDWYAFVFLVHEYEGRLSDSQEGILRWINDSDLLKLALWEGDRIFIPWLDRPGFFSGKFIYQNGELIDHRVIFHDP